MWTWSGLFFVLHWIGFFWDSWIYRESVNERAFGNLKFYVHFLFFFSFLSLFFFRERERNINSLFHLFMHSLVDFYVCSDWELNSQPGCIRTTLQPTELPGQGLMCIFLKLRTKASSDCMLLMSRNWILFICIPYSAWHIVGWGMINVCWTTGREL